MFRWLRRVVAGSAQATVVRLDGDGTFPLQVVGESHYQEHLEALCGGRRDHSIEHTVTARVVLDDANRYDRNAVRVEVEGRPVGYLSRPDAKAYRQYLRKRRLSAAVAECQAQIRGGWARSPEDQGHFGIWLDFTLYA